MSVSMGVWIDLSWHVCGHVSSNHGHFHKHIVRAIVSIQSILASYPQDACSTRLYKHTVRVFITHTKAITIKQRTKHQPTKNAIPNPTPLSTPNF